MHPDTTKDCLGEGGWTNEAGDGETAVVKNNRDAVGCVSLAGEKRGSRVGRDCYFSVWLQSPCDFRMLWGLLQSNETGSLASGETPTCGCWETLSALKLSAAEFAFWEEVQSASHWKQLCPVSFSPPPPGFGL